VAADAPIDWWQTFFSGLAVKSWLMVTSSEQTRQEADFIQETLGTAPPAKLLDVPCGGGRHCHALAGRGHDMTGVDLSDEFLKAARSSAHAPHAKITWEKRDMRDMPWPNRFDGAYSFGNSFAYLDDEGNAAFLEAIVKVLKPGARFVLDTGYVLEALLPALQERSWYPLGDMLWLAERRYDPRTSRLHVEYTWIRNGQTEKRSMSARLYTYRELLGLFAQAGFTDSTGYGSLARDPFRVGSTRLLVVASKPAGSGTKSDPV
jgi:SAM-dependent methyltransferase